MVSIFVHHSQVNTAHKLAFSITIWWSHYHLVSRFDGHLHISRLRPVPNEVYFTTDVDQTKNKLHLDLGSIQKRMNSEGRSSWKRKNSFM